ncbi:hypothetical protein [Sphingomonas sp. DT-204]|uniref:hypothetical protein n=1 Tax=Sphingomonas sp. DT-204 TaxID=3396166 RepID=UPI003F1BD04F
MTKSVHAQEAEVQKAAARMKGWDRLFGSPATTIPAVNQFGFHAPDYAATSGEAESKGNEIVLSNSYAKAPNKAQFVASGKDAAAIDQLAFALKITDPESAKAAKERFGKLIRDFMFSARAEGAEAVQKAIDAEKPADGELSGVAYALKVEPLDGAKDNRVITVTFTHPDTKSATSKS